MKIYLIRHGETAWNAGGRLQGHSDTPLDEKGIDLARKAGEALRDVPFAAAFSSPLKRAVQTAQLILGDRPVAVQTDDRLKEMGFGVLEGIRHHEAQYADFVRMLNDDTAHYQAPEGGESFLQVEERVYGFFQELIRTEELQGQCVLVASHGAAIRGLLNKLYDGGDLSRFWGNGVHKNCAVTIFDADKTGRIQLEAEGKVFY